MKEKFSGRAAFGYSIAGTIGLAASIGLLFFNLCFMGCTKGPLVYVGLLAGPLSMLLLTANFFIAAKAIRRRDGRPWAIAALCLQGPLVFFVLFAMTFGLRSPLAVLGLG